MAIITVTKRRFILQRLIDFGGRYIYRNDHKDTEYNRICSTHMDATMRAYLIKMAELLGSFSFGLFGPVHVYFVYGTKTTLTNVRIPFCEPNSHAEFLGNLLCQTVIATHGMLNYIKMETYHTLFENIVIIAPKLVKSDLDHVIQLYGTKSISQAEFRWKINKIVMQSSVSDR